MKLSRQLLPKKRVPSEGGSGGSVAHFFVVSRHARPRLWAHPPTALRISGRCENSGGSLRQGHVVHGVDEIETAAGAVPTSVMVQTHGAERTLLPGETTNLLLERQLQCLDWCVYS
jgi:hypothetical protein